MNRFSLGKLFVPVVAAITLIYLLLPIGHVILFSFNDAGRNNITWRGFTLDNGRTRAERRPSARRSATAFSSARSRRSPPP